MKFYDRLLKIKKLSLFCHSFHGLRFSFSECLPCVSRSGLLSLLWVGALVGGAFLTGCREESKDLQAKTSVEKCSESVQFEPVESDYFSIGKLCGVDVAVVRSVVGKDTLVHKYVMMDSAAATLGTDLRKRGFPEEWLSAVVLRVPLNRVAALSTSQVGYMLRLGLRDNIVGVSDGQYIVDSILYERAQKNTVASIGYDAGALEKLMALNLDLVLDFTTGGDYDNYEQIARTNLPLMLTSEWQENTPLAKLEWIKLYGILFGIRAQADSIFEQEKQKYETLKALITSATPNSELLIPNSHCPKVLAGMSYGGVWHASGGKSFTANLVRDAGGCYVWASDTSRELTFSFEEVYALADSVDVWVNPSMFAKADEILALEPRVKNIKAFRDKKVFQNDGIKGPAAGNDFYEGAITRPAELLWNLTKCIKGSVPGVNSIDTSYKWYRNIYNF